MKEVNIDGSDFVKNDGERTISGPDFVEVIKAVIERGSSLRFTAKGYSMTPFIKCGDIITISPLKDKIIAIGTIVAFINPENNKLVVHRVIARARNGYLIKGDNVFEADGLIPQCNILGRVKRVEHKSIAIPLGLGPEKKLIALLGRTTPVIPFSMIAWRNIRDFILRRSSCCG